MAENENPGKYSHTELIVKAGQAREGPTQGDTVDAAPPTSLLEKESGF